MEQKIRFRSGMKIKDDLELVRRSTITYPNGHTYGGWICRFWWGEEKFFRLDILKRIIGKRNHKFHRGGKIAAMRCRIGVYKRGARTRKLCWEISEDLFQEITTQKCHYCGVEPNQKAWYYDRKDPYIYNGIDRVDNTMGYTKENCVPCCIQCNRAKGTLTVEEFVLWIRRVIQNSETFTK